MNLSDDYKVKTWENNGKEVLENPAYQVSISIDYPLCSHFGFNNLSTIINLDNSNQGISLHKLETWYMDDDCTETEFEPAYLISMCDKKTGMTKTYYLTEIEPDSYKKRIPQEFIDKEEKRNYESFVYELMNNEELFKEVFHGTYEEIRLSDEETIEETIRRLF